MLPKSSRVISVEKKERPQLDHSGQVIRWCVTMQRWRNFFLCSVYDDLIPVVSTEHQVCFCMMDPVSITYAVFYWLKQLDTINCPVADGVHPRLLKESASTLGIVCKKILIFFLLVAPFYWECLGYWSIN